MNKCCKKREELKKERMESIYQSALYLFAMRGYNGVCTDTITQNANCSHGLLYHYFGNKEGLFIELMENVVVPNFYKIIENVDFDQKPKPLLKSFVNALLDALKDENDDYACSLYIIFNLYIQKKYIPKPRNDTNRKKIFQMFYEIIEAGQQEGVFYEDDKTKIVVSLISTIKGLASNRIHLGATDFICPEEEIIARMIIK